jgi:hypothetical protein
MEATDFSAKEMLHLQREIGRAKVMFQQHAYLTSEEDAQFRRYAKARGLDATALASVLLLRELRLHRLEISRFSATDSLGHRDRKVTAHLPTQAEKEAFVAHARNCGLKPATAAAILLRAELTERWLDRDMGSESS